LWDQCIHPLVSRSEAFYVWLMTLEEIIAALRIESAPTALTAGMAHAAELAPIVYAIADKFCDGVYLLPRDNMLLFNGLHVLAAARHPELCDHLMNIAEQDVTLLNELFPDHISISLARLLLSVWNRETTDLLELIERSYMPPDVNWAFYDVLARLTFDGRISRNETTAFLARIERDNLIDDGDMSWWGWEEAVMKLGLAELEPTLRRVWSKPIYGQHGEADHADTLDSLTRAAADPTDARLFDEEHIRVIDDPVEGVAWVEQRAAAMAAWATEHGEDANTADKDTDAAKTIRLTDDEEDWLAGFLSSPQVPDGTMSLEMLDGFFTALVIGPIFVLPSQYLPVVWGDDDDGPDWDSPEQAEYVLGLLAKHWNAIAARREANAEHRPIIEHFGMATSGEEWAVGFMSGIDMEEGAWDPLFDDKRGDQVVLPIMVLCRAVPEEIQEQITDEMRETILDQLPVALQMIAAYWRAPNPSLPCHEPVRSTKVGRNEPCPCGSGKKFKKCCGTRTPPMMH
jgi:uncharacterized protein